jgi:uncharacterized protein HI_1126
MLSEKIMLHRCPECRKKISESAEFCPNCGFSFKSENLEIYKQKLEERRLHNEEINRKSVKIHLIWGAIFALVLIVAGWLTNNP